MALATQPAADAEEEQPETETQSWVQSRDGKEVGESLMKRVIRSHGKRYLTFQFKPAKEVEDLNGHRAAQERDADNALLKYMTKAAVRKGKGYRAFRRGASASVRIAGINRSRFAPIDVPQGIAYFVYDRALPTTLVNGIELLAKGAQPSVKFLDIDAQTVFSLTGTFSASRTVGDQKGVAVELRCGTLTKTACGEVKPEAKVLAVTCKDDAIAKACVSQQGEVVSLSVGQTRLFRSGWNPEKPAPVEPPKPESEGAADAAVPATGASEAKTDPGEGP